jgi:hypothetical protein
MYPVVKIEFFLSYCTFIEVLYSSTLLLPVLKMQFIYFAVTHQSTRNTTAVPATKVATRAAANQMKKKGVY